jgi:hypothetical protein
VIAQKRFAHLFQRNVRLRLNEAKQKSLVKVELAPTRLSLLASHCFAGLLEAADPNNGCRNPNFKPRRRPTDRNSFLRSTKNPLTQINAVSSRHLCLPFKETHDSHCSPLLGIPLHYDSDF